MKKLLLKLAVGLVVLLVAAAVVLYFSLGSIVKKGVETVGPQVTKVSVTLDSAGVSPLTGSGTIRGLAVGNPEGFKTGTAIRLGEASLAVDAMSVFSDKVRVKSVNIAGPEITYETAFKGSNLSKLLENVEASADAGGGGESGGTSKKLQVDELSITGGKIHLSATMLGGQAMTLPLPDIHLKDLGTDEEGITPAELVQKVMKEVTSSATKVVTEQMAKLGKNVGDAAGKAGETVTDSAKKATEGVKSLFKRK